MIIDKIKVVYKLTASYPFSDVLQKVKNKGVWSFQDFLDRYSGTYSISEQLNLDLSVMRKINSWQDYYKFNNSSDESSVSFFIGRLKALGDVNRNYCMIEWNPNKADLPDVIKSFLHFRKAVVHRISSIDIAFDLHNVPIQNICFVAHGSTSTMTIGTIGSSVTRYLRPKCKDGRIKIYDKEKEREGFQDYQNYIGVTRVEITYQNVEFLLIDFLKNKSEWVSADLDLEISDLFKKNIYEPYEKPFIFAYKRVSQMLRYLDAVRVFDAFRGCKASDFGLKQYQLDMFDAYIEKFGFQNLSLLFKDMATHTRQKYRAYSDYISKNKARPLFKGCASDYFFALRSLLLEVLPCPYVDEESVISFHHFDDELPF